MKRYYEYLIEIELKKLPSLDEIEDDRPRMKSYNEEDLDDLWWKYSPDCNYTLE